MIVERIPAHPRVTSPANCLSNYEAATTYLVEQTLLPHGLTKQLCSFPFCVFGKTVRVEPMCIRATTS